jgi:pimeloyl-ACP methyl ester carboxylesterase
MAELYRSQHDEAEVRRWCTDRLQRWSVPHTSTVISTPLGPTHLTVLGAGPDVCVYLPGTDFNAATSTVVLSALAERSRVVCADLPGQPGLSAAQRSGTFAASQADWVGSVLAEARGGAPAGRLVLAGHSRGAASALSADPHAVDSLVLLSPAGLASVHLTVSTVLRSVAWLVRPGDRTSARLVSLMAGAETGADLAEVAEWLTLVARTSRTSGAPGPLPPATVRRWRGHRVRILVGENDVFFPPERLAKPARRHLEQRPDVVPGAGHLLTSTHAEAVAATVAAELG